MHTAMISLVLSQSVVDDAYLILIWKGLYTLLVVVYFTSCSNWPTLWGCNYFYYYRLVDVKFQFYVEFTMQKSDRIPKRWKNPDWVSIGWIYYYVVANPARNHPTNNTKMGEVLPSTTRSRLLEGFLSQVGFGSPPVPLIPHTHAEKSSSKKSKLSLIYYIITNNVILFWVYYFRSIN